MRILSAIFLLLIIVSCTDHVPSYPEPEDCMSKSEMADVLKEIMLVESHVQIKYIQLPKYYEMMAKTGDSILKARGFTEEQFKSSLDYYGSMQEEMMGIYNDVIAKLQKEKAALEKE